MDMSLKDFSNVVEKATLSMAQFTETLKAKFDRNEPFVKYPHRVSGLLEYLCQREYEFARIQGVLREKEENE